MDDRTRITVMRVRLPGTHRRFSASPWEAAFCTSTSADPNLTIAETSGYSYDYDPPLYQWWRHGGWFVGAQPGAAFFDEGNVHATQYGSRHQLSARADADVAGITPAASGHQAIFRAAEIVRRRGV